MNPKIALALVLTAATCVSGPAMADDAKEAAAVAKQLPTAKITLQQGLTASESTGQPISAKFEIDEGHFQLSVYTAKGAAFQEVLIDYTTGKIAKAGPLDEADDIADAKKQMGAMSKARTALKAAVDKAEQDTSGYRAVSVVPKMKDGHAIAVVMLMKGTQSKTVPESLE